MERRTPALALYTFGVLKAPLADPEPVVREFHDRAEAVYRHIGSHPGYLAHARPTGPDHSSVFDARWGEWGEFAVPRWYDRGRCAATTALAATLSLWSDPASAVEAVYTGLHRAALRRRHDWFQRSEHPAHVCWWIPQGTTPTWQDGVARLQELDADGPTPRAFTLRHPHAPTSTSTSHEQDAVPSRSRVTSPHGG